MMKNYNETTYGEKNAETYDEFYSFCDPASIDLLVELAGQGPALELGIGTGRIALPLVEKGVKVFGIDKSGILSGLKRRDRSMNINLVSPL